MSYRCLMIVNPARIRCKNEQLLIETEEVHSVPIEDISAIVLESRPKYDNNGCAGGTGAKRRGDVLVR